MMDLCTKTHEFCASKSWPANTIWSSRSNFLSRYGNITVGVARVAYPADYGVPSKHMTLREHVEVMGESTVRDSN